jgi:uncharacterized DUF497 family protein
MDFRWNKDNIEHVATHGVSPEEAEWVVGNARSPYPREIGDGKYWVCGRGRGGRLLQVIYLVDEDGTIYVIHARLLTDKEKHRWRRTAR